MRKKYIGLVAVIGMLTFGSSALAGIVVNISEVGSDVVATATGSFDLSAVNYLFDDPPEVYSYMWLEYDALTFGGTGQSYYSADTFVGSGSDMGSGDQVLATSSNEGLILGAYSSGTLLLGTGYVSGAAINREMTFADASLSSLGLNEGSYTWTYTTGGNTDTYTMVVGAVPEPATFAFIGVFGGGLLAVRRIFMM